MLERLTPYRQRAALAAAIVLPVAVAAVLVPFRGTFATTAAALVLVAVIVGLAIVGSRAAGILASISSALWFDFFLTRPYDQFAISHRPDIETTVALVVVGLIVTELAARSRHHSRVSFEESSYVGVLDELADLAAGPALTSSVVASATASLTDLLGLRACRFEREPVTPPLARILANGEVEHVGLDWPAEEIGIPGPEAEILARWHGHGVGSFVITPTPGLPVPVERRAVAVALATIVAARLDDERQGA
jgi:K+-sensing histidine kinase KdpD